MQETIAVHNRNIQQLTQKLVVKVGFSKIKVKLQTKSGLIISLQNHFVKFRMQKNIELLNYSLGKNRELYQDNQEK